MSEVSDGWATLVCSYDWPCDEALAVMLCESSGRADAVSPDGQNIGLMQINVVHGYWPEPKDNVRVAYGIWKESGWAPWSCKP